MIAESEISTVLAEYNPIKKIHKTYQSEQDLENELIENLKEQGYEYLKIHNSDDLKCNLRTQLQRLNDYFFLIPNGKDSFPNISLVTPKVLSKKPVKFKKKIRL